MFIFPLYSMLLISYAVHLPTTYFSFPTQMYHLTRNRMVYINITFLYQIAFPLVALLVVCLFGFIYPRLFDARSFTLITLAVTNLSTFVLMKITLIFLAFGEAFITTFRTFITPSDLIEKLMHRYTLFCCQISEPKQKSAKESFSLLVRVVNDLT